MSNRKKKPRPDPGVPRIKLQLAVRAIRSGGIIAYPTEGVFGLGCDPDNVGGVLRILDLKRRDISAGLILIAASRAQLDGWIEPTIAELERLNADTSDADDAITWIVTAGPRTPPWITGHRSTVAIRITRHPTAKALCRLARMPLISTSANRHGQKPAKASMAVRRSFGASLDYILPGQTGNGGGPTEIRDARTGAVLRAA
jgi:L-threonylcarbamoyladenylate synthase